MKLNSRILLLAHMVYLLPKHTLLLVAFIQSSWYTYVHYMLSYGAISCYSPCCSPSAMSPCQLLPFSLTYLESLLCVVRSRPPWTKIARILTSPPHSNFPTPQGFPKPTVRPTKTTSRSRLYIVRNNNSSSCAPNSYVKKISPCPKESTLNTIGG